MDSPTDSAADEAASAPATYVPEPFDGLPEIFGADDSTARSWRVRHRPPRAPKRRKPVGAHAAIAERAARADTVPELAQRPDAGAVRGSDTPAVVAPPSSEPDPVPSGRQPEPVVLTPPPVAAAPPPIRQREPEPMHAAPPPPPPPPPPPVQQREPDPVQSAPPPPPQPQPPARPAQPPLPEPPQQRIAPAPPPPIRMPAPPPPPAPVRVVLPEPAPSRLRQPASTWWPALPPPAPPEPVTTNYQPEPYDPRTAGAVLPAADILQLYGSVLRKRRKRGGLVTLLVLCVILLGTGYYAWRQIEHRKHRGPTDVAYTSAAGHFSARFPAAPTEQTTIQRHGKLRLRLQTVGDPVDHVAVASARLSTPIPKKQRTALLIGLSKGLGSDGVLTLARQQRAVFRGHPAIEGELWAADGSPFTFLATLYGDRQIFVLLAPAGASYAELQASFIPIG